MPQVIGPRHREDGGFSPSTNPKASYWWNTSQNPKPSPVYTALADCLGTKKEMDDVVTEAFARRSAAGEIITNPMAARTQTRAYLSVGPSFRKVVNGVTYNGELLGAPWLDTADSYSAYGRVLRGWSDLAVQTRTRALANVKPPNFTGLVSLGELGSTLRYLRNPFSTGMALASQLQRRVGKSARLQRRDASYKEMANLTAEYMYGVRPLVKEVSEILLALQTPFLKRMSERSTFRAQGDQLDSDSWVTDGSISGGAITFKNSFTYNREIVIGAGLLYEYFEDVSFQSSLGISIEQVPTAVWQLMPLSFVVDWFVNVSQFLRAITPVAGAKRLAEWETFRMREKFVHSASQAKFSDWSTTKDFTGANTWTKTEKVRNPSVGTPELYLKDVRQVLGDVDKLIGLLALSVQRVQGASRITSTYSNIRSPGRMPTLHTFS